MRTLVVGDIHGGYKALEQVLERSKFNPIEDQIIFLGDYVDGWSQSAEVVDRLINIKGATSPTNPAVFLRGNHDKWCEDWLLMGQAPIIWTQQGGQSTIDSYVSTGYIVEESHKKFFKELKNYHTDYNGNGFVHGGFRSRKGLGHEVYQADYYWDRDLWNIAVMSHSKINSRLPITDDKGKILLDGTPSQHRFYKHREIFIGHTSTLNYNVKPHLPEYQDERQPRNGGIRIPMNRCNVWNMDTGGGFKGKLTVMDINTKEFWQSDLLSELYPEEKGRYL